MNIEPRPSNVRFSSTPRPEAIVRIVHAPQLGPRASTWRGELEAVGAAIVVIAAATTTTTVAIRPFRETPLTIRIPNLPQSDSWITIIILMMIVITCSDGMRPG
jgi:hypothetical protein